MKGCSTCRFFLSYYRRWRSRVTWLNMMIWCLHVSASCASQHFLCHHCKQAQVSCSVHPLAARRGAPWRDISPFWCCSGSPSRGEDPPERDRSRTKGPLHCRVRLGHDAHQPTSIFLLYDFCCWFLSLLSVVSSCCWWVFSFSWLLTLPLSSVDEHHKPHGLLISQHPQSSS